jgi:hypothetical protein
VEQMSPLPRKERTPAENLREAFSISALCWRLARLKPFRGVRKYRPAFARRQPDDARRAPE